MGSAATGRLRELAEKATPGPWEAFPLTPWDDGFTNADAAFIAAVSPEVVLALCDVADAAQPFKRHAPISLPEKRLRDALLALDAYLSAASGSATSAEGRQAE